jgi:hypothetical protein
MYGSAVSLGQKLTIPFKGAVTAGIPSETCFHQDLKKSFYSLEVKLKRNTRMQGLVLHDNYWKRHVKSQLLGYPSNMAESKESFTVKFLIWWQTTKRGSSKLCFLCVLTKFED